MTAFVARLRTWTVTVTGAVVLAACASGPDIRRDTNPAAQFGSYKTFGFFTEMASDRPGYESVFTTRMKQATRHVMEGKGYRYVDEHPDLLLNFFANLEDRQEIRSTPASLGYYGYRDPFFYGMSTPEIETIDYKQGTVTIDLVDREGKFLAWSATAEGRVRKQTLQDPGPAIDAIARELMAPLPAAPGGM